MDPIQATLEQAEGSIVRARAAWDSGNPPATQHELTLLAGDIAQQFATPDDEQPPAADEPARPDSTGSSFGK